MFTEAKSPANTNISDAAPELFESFLEFLYTGDVSDWAGRELALLELADRYLVEDLTESCEARLKNMDVSTALGVIGRDKPFLHSGRLRGDAVRRLIREKEALLNRQDWAVFRDRHPVLADVISTACTGVSCKPERRQAQSYEPSVLDSHLNAARKAGTLCDVVLHVDGEDFHAHKLVLSVSSPVFQTMFSGNFTEAAASRVDIEGVSSDLFEEFLNFLYTEELPSSCLPLLELSDRYMVANLQESCENMLLHMDALTALEVLGQDKAFLGPRLRRAAARWLIIERMGLTDNEWSPFQERCPVLADVIDVANEVLRCCWYSTSGSTYNYRCNAWPTGPKMKTRNRL